MGDPAVLRLPENLVQYSNWNNTAVNQLMKYIPSPDTLQLVSIANQQYLCTWCQASKQLMCQPHIHHGCLIHNQQSGLQRLFFLRSAVISVELQKTVQGLCVLNSCSLRHAAAGFAGGSRQRNFFIRVQHTKCLHNRQQNGTFTSTGSAGNNRQIISERHFHALGLPLR